MDNKVPDCAAIGRRLGKEFTVRRGRRHGTIIIRDTCDDLDVAKLQFSDQQQAWLLYWPARRQGRWRRYAEDAAANTIDDLLSLIEVDEYGCFRG